MQFRSLVRENVNYSDLVESAESVGSALSELEKFLDVRDAGQLRQRQRHVIHVIYEMVDVGKIKQNNEKYPLIDEFYLKHFNANAPYYVAQHVNLQKVG